MSDISSLSELARFVGGAKSVTGPRRRAVNAAEPAARLHPERRSVGELLGVVLALSARTRRLVLPKVSVDLDVFSPDGRRAVRLLLPNPDRLAGE